MCIGKSSHIGEYIPEIRARFHPQFHTSKITSKLPLLSFNGLFTVLFYCLSHTSVNAKLRFAFHYLFPERLTVTAHIKYLSMNCLQYSYIVLHNIKPKLRFTFSLVPKGSHSQLHCSSLAFVDLHFFFHFFCFRFCFYSVHFFFAFRFIARPIASQ